MYCRKCGNKLNQTDLFCGNCGNKIIIESNKINSSSDIESTSNINKAFKKSIISFVLFIIMAIILILACYLYNTENSGMAGIFIFLAVAILFLPFIVSIMMFTNSIEYYKKCNPSEITKKHKTFKIINLLQAPILIIILVLGIYIKESNIQKAIKEKLSNLYENNYEVIESCSFGDESGTSSNIVALRIQDFPFPVIAEFDWNLGTYEDNYDELKETSALGYQAYINNIFNGNAVSLMDIIRHEEYKSYQIYLNVLITSDQINNKEVLKNNIVEIVKKYFYMYPEYVFFFELYVIDEIDKNNMEQYYLFLSSGKSDCNGKLNDTLELSNKTNISIQLSDNDDLESIINNEIESFYNENQ